MKVLAGDLGGTKTLLLIAEYAGVHLKPLVEQRYASARFDGLLPLVRAFVAEAGEHARDLHAACIAVAGPVTPTATGQEAHITNLPWEMSNAALAEELGTPRTRLINDFQGIAYGIEALGAQHLAPLQAGHAVAQGPRVVIGAGTGLGQGVLVWQHDHYENVASEGGHTDFAPADEEQIGLLRELQTTLGHVSWERLVSGPGLVTLYEYLHRHTRGADPAQLAQVRGSRDPAAAISTAGLAGTDAVAQRALDLFVRLYGAQAGNLALTCLATGGVYLAGGIAPQILPKLRDGRFLEAFLNKGRMRRLLVDMPVQVILDTRVGLLGAALAASRL